MRKHTVILLCCLVLCGMLSTSCVHEFPQLFPNRMTLTFKFETDLPFYREYIVDTRAEEGSYRQRYILKGYTLYDDGTTASEPSFTQVWYFSSVLS